MSFTRDLEGRSAARRLWIYRIGTMIALAVVVHVLVVWAVPRLIMRGVLNAAPPASAGSRVGGAFFPPMTDATQRRVVMPSPDLLYATCTFDLGPRPLRVRADPTTPNYWSIALYAANSDNFFVLNDRQAQGRPVDLLLIGPDAYATPPIVPPGARVVAAPTARGLLLMRVLVGDPGAENAVVEAARRTLACESM